MASFAVGQMSAVRASIKAADALARKAVQRGCACEGAVEAYRDALALTIRGSKDAKHCLLRMARLLRILGHYEEAVKEFSACLALRGDGEAGAWVVFVTYERMACVVQWRMPAMYADMARAYDKTAYVLSIHLDGADTVMVGLPWAPANAGRTLCASDGMLPSLMKACSACDGDYASAAIAAMSSENLLPYSDTTALRRDARAAVLEGRRERAVALSHGIIASAVSPVHVMLAIADVASMRYMQGRFQDAYAAAMALGPSAPPSVLAAATDAAKSRCAEVAVASHMRSWGAGVVPLDVVERATARMNMAATLVYGTLVYGTGAATSFDAEYVLPPTDDGWSDAVLACRRLDAGLSAERTSDTTHALQRCNNARIAEDEGEWSEAAQLWEVVLASVCTPAVLRGIKSDDLASLLCVHLMTCPALSPAEQDAISDAWLLGYDRPEPLSFEALVAGRATFRGTVESDLEILSALLARRDACAYGPHPSHASKLTL